MRKEWIMEIFGCRKPIIAMCHLGALPGDPLFDRVGGMNAVVKWAQKDLMALQKGGVDAVMFSNEFSFPYMTRVVASTVAAMARVIGELMPIIHVPYGVNVLWDPVASLDLAAATGAKFVREIFTGAYASDFGIWNTNCGAAVRHQHSLAVEQVKLLFNILPEAAQYLGDRDISEIARSTVFNARPDALCVSGLIAGARTDPEALRKVKAAVGDMPVFSNTGVCKDNVKEQLSIVDGAVVGTAFKYDGEFDNHVDEDRVKAFMAEVQQLR